jgi:hypothetical protein
MAVSSAISSVLPQNIASSVNDNTFFLLQSVI